MAGVTLNRKYPGHPNKGSANSNQSRDSEQHGSHVIIASEPTTFDEDEWSLIDANNIVLVDKDGKVKMEKVQYDTKFDAVDPNA